MNFEETWRTLFWPRLSSPVSGRPVLTAGGGRGSTRTHPIVCQRTHRAHAVEGGGPGGGQRRISGVPGGNVAPVENARREEGRAKRREAARKAMVCCGCEGLWRVRRQCERIWPR